MHCLAQSFERPRVVDALTGHGRRIGEMMGWRQRQRAMGVGKQVIKRASALSDGDCKTAGLCRRCGKDLVCTERQVHTANDSENGGSFLHQRQADGEVGVRDKALCPVDGVEDLCRNRCVCIPSTPSTDRHRTCSDQAYPESVRCPPACPECSPHRTALSLALVDHRIGESLNLPPLSFCAHSPQGVLPKGNLRDVSLEEQGDRCLDGKIHHRHRRGIILHKVVSRGKVLLGLMRSSRGHLHFVRHQRCSANDGGCAASDSSKIHPGQTIVMEQTDNHYSEIAGGGDDAPEYP